MPALHTVQRTFSRLPGTKKNKYQYNKTGNHHRRQDSDVRTYFERNQTGIRH